MSYFKYSLFDASNSTTGTCGALPDPAAEM